MSAEVASQPRSTNKESPDGKGPNNPGPSAAMELVVRGLT